MSIFAGFDLASESVVFHVENEGGKVLKQGKMTWSARKWKEFVEELGAKELKVGFETGPEAYRAQRMLKRLGVEIYPFHAGHFPSIWKTKKKTDRIDAKRICGALRMGGLPERVTLPEDQGAILRNLTSERELTLKQLGQRRNRIRGLGRQWGVKLPRYDTYRPERWWDRVMGLFPSSLREMVKRQVIIGLGLMQVKEGLEEEIVSQLEKAGLREEAKRIETIPGIGSVIAAGAVAYLGDGSRLTSGRKTGSYVGLVPTVSVTGIQTPRLGHITKEGPPVLRRLFVQAAHAAVQSKEFQNTRWWDWFQRLSRRKGRKIAIVALARRLAVLCNTVLRNKTEWDIGRLRRTTV